VGWGWRRVQCGARARIHTNNRPSPCDMLSLHRESGEKGRGSSRRDAGVYMPFA
jgi:hypothetical protein